MNASATVRKSSQTAAKIVRRLVDLRTLCLHVLQTDDEAFDHLLKICLARQMANGLPVFPAVSRKFVMLHFMSPSVELPFMDERRHSKFVDTLSRAVSKCSSFTKQYSQSYNRVSSFYISQSSHISKDLTSAEIKLRNATRMEWDSISRANKRTLTKECQALKSFVHPLVGPQERLNNFGVLEVAVGNALSEILLPATWQEPFCVVKQ